MRYVCIVPQLGCVCMVQQFSSSNWGSGTCLNTGPSIDANARRGVWGVCVKVLVNLIQITVFLNPARNPPSFVAVQLQLSCNKES